MSTPASIFKHTVTRKQPTWGDYESITADDPTKLMMPLWSLSDLVSVPGYVRLFKVDGNTIFTLIDNEADYKQPSKATDLTAFVSTPKDQLTGWVGTLLKADAVACASDTDYGERYAMWSCSVSGGAQSRVCITPAGGGANATTLNFGLLQTTDSGMSWNDQSVEKSNGNQHTMYATLGVETNIILDTIDVTNTLIFDASHGTKGDVFLQGSCCGFDLLPSNSKVIWYTGDILSNKDYEPDDGQGTSPFAPGPLPAPLHFSGAAWVRGVGTGNCDCYSIPLDAPSDVCTTETVVVSRPYNMKLSHMIKQSSTEGPMFDVLMLTATAAREKSLENKRVYVSWKTAKDDNVSFRVGYFYTGDYPFLPFGETPPTSLIDVGTLNQTISTSQELPFKAMPPRLVHSPHDNDYSFYLVNDFAVSLCTLDANLDKHAGKGTSQMPTMEPPILTSELRKSRIRGVGFLQNRDNLMPWLKSPIQVVARSSIDDAAVKVKSTISVFESLFNNHNTLRITNDGVLTVTADAGDKTNVFIQTDPFITTVKHKTDHAASHIPQVNVPFTLFSQNGLFVVEYDGSCCTLLYNTFNAPTERFEGGLTRYNWDETVGTFGTMCNLSKTTHVKDCFDVYNQYCQTPLVVKDPKSLNYLDSNCQCSNPQNIVENAFSKTDKSAQDYNEFLGVAGCLYNNCATEIYVQDRDTFVADYMKKQCDRNITICDTTINSKNIDVQGHSGIQISQCGGSKPSPTPNGGGSKHGGGSPKGGDSDLAKTHWWVFLLISVAVVGAIVAGVYLVKKSRNNANHDAPAPVSTVKMAQQR